MSSCIEISQHMSVSAGPRGLFTGYLPTLLEDVPDMAFKFAAYETMRNVHKQITARPANAQEDFAMGAVSGAFAAAATTPLDVIKTTMMCTAASRPTVVSASRTILAQGGLPFFFRYNSLSFISIHSSKMSNLPCFRTTPPPLPPLH